MMVHTWKYQEIHQVSGTYYRCWMCPPWIPTAHVYGVIHLGPIPSAAVMLSFSSCTAIAFTNTYKSHASWDQETCRLKLVESFKPVISICSTSSIDFDDIHKYLPNICDFLYLYFLKQNGIAAVNKLFCICLLHNSVSRFFQTLMAELLEKILVAWGTGAVRRRPLWIPQHTRSVYQLILKNITKRFIRSCT